MSEYKNIVDVLGNANYIKQLPGTVVFSHRLVDDGVVAVNFAPFGCACYVFWYIVMWYCAIQSCIKDLTVVGHLFSSKLKHYGEWWEFGFSLIYLVFTMWKIPFGFNKSKAYIQVIVTIDSELQREGITVRYNKMHRVLLILSVVQIFLCVAHFTCILVVFYIIDAKKPYELMIYDVYVNFLVFNSVLHYAVYMYILKVRFSIVNKTLMRIKSKKVYFDTTVKVSRSEARKIVNNIKMCARIYSLLNEAGSAANRMFSMTLSLTIFYCVVNMILYMFYFLEVHANGLLYQNDKSYTCFMIYAGWEVSYGLGVIILSIFFCEDTIFEAKRTAYMVHQIINREFTQTVTAAAMQLSQQLLHQSPAFSATGIYRLEYIQMMQGARSLATFLVILLELVLR